MIRNGRVKDEDAGATVVFFFGNHPDLSSAVAGPWSRIVRKKMPLRTSLWDTVMWDSVLGDTIPTKNLTIL